MSCGELVAPSIASASQLITQQLLTGNKVICCGNGLSSSLASMFSQCLILQHRFERPGLPALNLSNNQDVVSAIAEQHVSEVYSKQLHSLGQQGDILTTFSTGSNPANLVQAIHTAHDREMHVVAFTTDQDHDLLALLSGDDVAITISNIEPHRVAEIHLLGLFSVCELIDQQLFGGT